VLAATTGCTAIFGLEDPERMRGGQPDAPLGDVVYEDAAGDGAAVPLVRRIDITDDEVSGGPHADFPLLVSESATWLRSRQYGGDVASDLGNDLRFTSDQAGAALLAFEIEDYDPMTGTLVAWIKVPLSATTEIYLHYGDSTIVSSQQNATAVWASYGLVLHMGASPADSSAQNVITASALTGADGTISDSTAFNGLTSSLTMVPGAAVNGVFAGGGFVSAWIRPATYGEGGQGRILEKDGAGGWQFHVDNGRCTACFRFTFDTTAAASDGEWLTPASSVSLGAWHHVALVMNTDNVTNDPSIYLDGAVVSFSQVGTVTGSYLSDATSVLYVGSNDGADATFAGGLDEVRISTTVRTPQWIATEYANQSMPAMFYTVSAPL